MSSRRIVAGVDGCPGGWVAVVWHPGTAALEPHLGRDWSEIAARLGDVARLCVDMPVGLADRGGRDCDTAARRLLPRGKSASVSPTPRR